MMISRSGTTTEVVRAIERMREEATLTTAITAVARLPDRRPHRAPRRLSTSPTSARSSRRASPRPRSRSCARTSGRTSTAAIADAERALTMPLPHDPAGLRPLRVPRRTAGPSGSPTKPRSSSARRPRPTPRATPRWSTATARSAWPAPTSLVWILGSPDPAVAERRRRHRRNRASRRTRPHGRTRIDPQDGRRARRVARSGPGPSAPPDPVGGAAGGGNEMKKRAMVLVAASPRSR